MEKILKICNDANNKRFRPYCQKMNCPRSMLFGSNVVFLYAGRSEFDQTQGMIGR